LLDKDVLRVVLNSTFPYLAHAIEGHILNYKAVYAVGEDFSILVSASEERSFGEVIELSSSEQVERLCYFEGIEFELKTASIQTKSGKKEYKTFFPTSLLVSSNRTWSFDDWTKTTDRGKFLMRVKTYMKKFHLEQNPLW